MEALMRDSGSTFQELTAEAFADLLKKHKQPAGLEGISQGECRKAN
jgi:hypothetical protein